MKWKLLLICSIGLNLAQAIRIYLATKVDRSLEKHKYPVGWGGGNIEPLEPDKNTTTWNPQTAAEAHDEWNIVRARIARMRDTTLWETEGGEGELPPGVRYIRTSVQPKIQYPNQIDDGHVHRMWFGTCNKCGMNMKPEGY